MIKIEHMDESQVHRLQDIDRSEHIDLIFEERDGQIQEIAKNHECGNWDEDTLNEIKERFLYEIRQGGMAVGAFDGDKLAGFGVLAHQFRGMDGDQLQVDLMYVSRHYRRQGIGSRIMNALADEARRRGAAYLYISSTETRSAVSFYRSHGSVKAEKVDEELFAKEPKDIHMVIKL